MNALISFLINRLVAWAAGISASNFGDIVGWVKIANDRYQDSADKGKFVRDSIKTVWPKLSGFLINLLLELAVTAVRKGVK